MFKHLWKSIVRCATGLGSHSRACCADRRMNRRLNLEQLELRDCPAVTIVRLCDSLRITGDADTNLIEIVDRGRRVLNVNGTEYSGICSLMIDVKGGADKVRYETVGMLSLWNLQLKLGSGDDIADLKLGAVEGSFRSEIDGSAGTDSISTAFDAVFAGSDARSFMDGGSGNDVIKCRQNNLAGSASCSSRGGSGDDNIFCEKTNVMAGGRAECISDGGSGDDFLSCTLTNLAEGGSALCDQTGMSGNDQIICDKGSVQGKHVCFLRGGSGDDLMKWNVRGAENSGDFQCHADAGTGDDRIEIAIGSENEEVGLTGPVEYFADTGSGNDQWIATVNFTQDSNGVISPFTVLLGTGNDIGVLNVLDASDFIEHPDDPDYVQISNGLFTGGPGDDTYLGPPPSGLQFPVEGFEIGV